MRADELVLRLRLASTRSRAAALIRSGRIRAGSKLLTKPGARVEEGTDIGLIGDDPDFASRGAFKLQFALDRFGVEATGKIVLDLGASTGGFTDLLLRRGASRIHAVDIGHGQLLERLKHDPRVVPMEGVDARSLDKALIPDPLDLICADLAFISLTKALGPSLSLIRPGGDLIALIKPQFELDRSSIGKGGIVRNADLRARALDSVSNWISRIPAWRIEDRCQSPLPGGDGNIEFLVHARHDG
jgi:23S rRNA (cytidine1920-2'-O)/16S rRNA (cytidine1409-2'-O)-methyltransferase